MPIAILIFSDIIISKEMLKYKQLKHTLIALPLKIEMEDFSENSLQKNSVLLQHDNSLALILHQPLENLLLNL